MMLLAFALPVFTLAALEHGHLTAAATAAVLGVWAVALVAVGAFMPTATTDRLLADCRLMLRLLWPPTARKEFVSIL